MSLQQKLQKKLFIHNIQMDKVDEMQNSVEAKLEIDKKKQKSIFTK